MSKFTRISLLICMLLVAACQGKNIEKIYGKWEEVKQPTESLDFEHKDKDGNPTVKYEKQKGASITFAEKYSIEGDTTLETKYKEVNDGIIAVYFNGQEYLHVKIIDKDNIAISPKGNPQAVATLKRVK